MEEEYRAPQQRTGSSTPVSTAWPLPVLGIPTLWLPKTHRVCLGPWASSVPTQLLQTLWACASVFELKTPSVPVPLMNCMSVIAFRSIYPKTRTQHCVVLTGRAATGSWTLFNQRGPWKIFAVVLGLNLTSSGALRVRQGKPRSCRAQNRRHLKITFQYWECVSEKDVFII